MTVLVLGCIVTVTALGNTRVLVFGVYTVTVLGGIPVCLFFGVYRDSYCLGQYLCACYLWWDSCCLGEYLCLSGVCSVTVDSLGNTCVLVFGMYSGTAVALGYTCVCALGVFIHMSLYV